MYRRGVEGSEDRGFPPGKMIAMRELSNEAGEFLLPSLTAHDHSS